jgi:hypothetical protein
MSVKNMYMRAVAIETSAKSEMYDSYFIDSKKAAIGTRTKRVSQKIVALSYLTLSRESYSGFNT